MWSELLMIFYLLFVDKVIIKDKEIEESFDIREDNFVRVVEL